MCCCWYRLQQHYALFPVGAARCSSTQRVSWQLPDAGKTLTRQKCLIQPHIKKQSTPLTESRTVKHFTDVIPIQKSVPKTADAMFTLSFTILKHSQVWETALFANHSLSSSTTRCGDDIFSSWTLQQLSSLLSCQTRNIWFLLFYSHLAPCRVCRRGPKKVRCNS